MTLKLAHDHELRTIVAGDLQRVIESTSKENVRTKATVPMKRFADQLPAGADFDLPFVTPEVNLPGWITELTAGLIWSITGTHDNGSDWEGIWNWSPSFYPAAGVFPQKLAMRHIIEHYWLYDLFENSGQWRSGWTAGKTPLSERIYNFRVSIEDHGSRGSGMVIFRHDFLSGFVYYSRFRTSPLVKEAIMKFAPLVVERVPGTVYYNGLAYQNT
jgi:hypothetical protein